MNWWSSSQSSWNASSNGSKQFSHISGSLHHNNNNNNNNNNGVYVDGGRREQQQQQRVSRKYVAYHFESRKSVDFCTEERDRMCDKDL